MVSSALLFPDAGLLAAVFRRFVFKNVLRDAQEMEQTVNNSGLNWTIVRPVRLTTAPAPNACKSRRAMDRADAVRFLALMLLILCSTLLRKSPLQQGDWLVQMKTFDAVEP